jgi:hypothetical protein
MPNDTLPEKDRRNPLPYDLEELNLGECKNPGPVLVTGEQSRRRAYRCHPDLDYIVDV